MKMFRIASSAFLTATLLTSVPLASAQILYVSSGVTGHINQSTMDGTPLPNLKDYASGTTVAGLAVSNNFNIYAAVSTSSSYTVERITPGGVSSVYSTLTHGINGMAFNANGVLYGVSAGNGVSGGNAVGIIDESGFTPVTLTTSPFAPFYSSSALAFDSVGNMYVTNSSFGGAYAFDIVKLTPNGSNWDISLFATGDGYNPYGITIDEFDNVFVATSSIGGVSGTFVRKYSSAGVLDPSFTGAGGTITTPRGLVYAEGYVYEADYSTNDINRINPTTGEVVKLVDNANFNSTFIAYSAIPEPTHLALLGLGVMAAGSYIKRRKRA